MLSRHDIRDVAAQMIALVPADVLDDLRNEDPASAVEVHFEPVKVHQLPPARIARGDCSADGYYEQFLQPAHPHILYSDHGGAARARFTIVHELGHHILNTTGAPLLDDLDRIGGPTGQAQHAEELACHRFAGEVLVEARLLDDVIGGAAVTPRHVLRLHETANASWEALAVRVADYSQTKTAVVLIRQPGEVSFVAVNWLSSWPRGSSVEPSGPLDRALQYNTTAHREVYRYGLGGAEALFCDTARVDGGLAVAVLSPRPSNGSLSALEPTEPIWKEREEFCAWCGGERDVGWCDNCSGRRCRSCQRCECQTPIKNPLCPQCHLHSPFRPTAHVCMDCEAAGPSAP